MPSEETIYLGFLTDEYADLAAKVRRRCTCFMLEAPDLSVLADCSAQTTLHAPGCYWAELPEDDRQLVVKYFSEKEPPCK
jgi:hypothetical protein